MFYSISRSLLPCRMMADLNSPLFTPPQPSMDKKRILENVENKYREFISETLRCLIELKRDLCAYYRSYNSMKGADARNILTFFF